MAPNENLDEKEQNEENNKQQKREFKLENFNTSINDFIENGGFLTDSNIDLEKKYNEYKEFLVKNDNDTLLKFPKEEENLKKIKESLKSKLEMNFIYRKETIENLDSSINKTFNLDEEGKKKLSVILKNEKLDDLKNLVYFKNLQEKFLRKNGIGFKSNDQILKLKEVGIDKIEKLNSENTKKVLDFLNKIDGNSDIFSSELEAILNILDEVDHKNIINHFISKISLSKLVTLGIIKEDEEKTEKLKYLNKYKAENLISESINEEEGLKLINSDYIFLDADKYINFSEILKPDYSKLNPDQIEKDKQEKKEIKDEILGNILRGVNHLKSDISKEEYTSKIDFLKKLNPVGENENINNSFIDYVKKDPQLSYLKASIDKLQKDNYIVVTKTDINTGKEYRFVQKINQVDCGTTLYSKSIKLENLTSLYGILEKGEEKRVGYDDFYELLKSPVNNADQSVKINLEFLDADELKKLKEIKEIKDIVSDKEITSPADLQNKIDEIDPAGNGLKVNEKCACSFTVGKPGDKDYGVYSIVAIDDKNVTLSSKNKNGKNESFKLDEFFKLFSEKEAKRHEYVGTSDNFFAKLLKGEKLSGKFEFKDNKFIEKTENKDEAREVKYMVGKDGKAIKIEQIGHGNISICTGKYEEKKGKDKETIKSFELSYPQTVSYEDLYAYINENSLEVFMEDKEDKPDEVKDAKRGFSLGKAWLSMYSISDIVSGLSMLPKTIEESLKGGNSIKSAQFALAFGGILPDSIRLQLQSNVEAQEKKEMETLIGKWSVLDSKDFIPLLKKIILNASSEEYEKEAAMVFFLQKYGVLYGKGFKEFKGSFIWYIAMGGKQNDATYKEYKKTCEDGQIPFTEEGLIEKLLEKQATGELKPKRRSKFAKDYGGYIKKGISEEKTDGENKAGALLTSKGRIDYAVREFKNGTYHNGIGALKKVWEKGGSAKEMYAIPFLMTASGSSQSLTQDALNDYYSLAFTRVFSAIQFSKTQDDINLYNRVILKLAQSLGDDAFKKLDGALKKDKQHEKIDELNKFWGEYGDQMIKKLNINEDPEIFLKKDKDLDFKLYYEKIAGVYGATDFSTNKGDLQEGIYNHDHSSPFSFLGQNYLDKFVSVDPQSGSIKGDEGKIVFRNTIAGYKSIANFNISEDEKKKMFKFYYTSIAGRLSSAYAGVLADESRLPKLENASGKSLLKDMKNMGILLMQGHNIVGKTNDEFLEERWQDYKNRFGDGIGKKSQKNQVLQEKEHIFDDVENILSGKNKKNGVGEQNQFSTNQANTNKQSKKTKKR